MIDIACAPAVDAARLSTEVWVFGCFRNGHHVYTDQVARLPGHSPVPYEIERRCDAIGYEVLRDRQIEGAHASAWTHDGWSFVSWWDRQGDQRHGSHTGILARVEWSPEQLIEAGRAFVPWAFRVALPTVAHPGPSATDRNPT